MSVVDIDWSEGPRTGRADEFLVACSVEEKCGKVDQGRRDGGGGMLACDEEVNRRMRRGC